MTFIDRIEERAAHPASHVVVDVCLAAFFIVFSVITVTTQEITGNLHPARPADIVLAALVAAPIAVRRRVPFAAVAIACAAIFVLVTTHGPEGSTPLAVAVLVYSVAVWSPMRRAVIGLVIAVSTLAAIAVFGDGELTFLDVGFTTALFSIVWATGVAVRARRDASEARIRRTIAQAELSASRAAQAVAEERLRIARELHDVVAHSISIIAVQGGVARHFLHDDLGQTDAALAAIADTSRSTLTELRRLLGVLRDADGQIVNSPAPTLADLPQLIDDMRTLGMPIDLRITGRPSTEHLAIEMSAYRVIQESLTNVVKHAGNTRHVGIDVSHLPDRLDLRIEDDGPGTIATGAGRGNGLIGMHERVGVWGGTITADPGPDGGFVVAASFPLSSTS